MSDAAQPTVFVVDDDHAVRRALKRLVLSAGLQAETFATAEAFLKYHRDLSGPACLVLDVRMPGLSGTELQEHLAAMQRSVPIVFVTGHGTVPVSVRAMKLGAVDFLSKPLEAHQFLQAVTNAIEKDKAGRSKRAEVADIQRRIASLSPRQHQVMDMVVQGMLNKQIAHELGTTEKTVKVHRAHVMKKMRVRSVAQLVRLTERLGTASEDTPEI